MIDWRSRRAIGDMTGTRRGHWLRLNSKVAWVKNISQLTKKISRVGFIYAVLGSGYARLEEKEGTGDMSRARRGHWLRLGSKVA